MTTRTSVMPATLVLFLLCCIHTATGGTTTQHFTRPSTTSPKTPSATNTPGPAAAPSWGMSSMLLLQVMDAVQQISRYASSVENVSSPCVRDLGVVQKGLLNKEVWALKMVDAAGKPKPGILKGQRTLVGDYDECKEIAETITAGHVIEGQFCRLDVKTNFTGLGEAASSLSMLLETISVHVCVPNSCSETDIFNLFAGLADTVPGGKLAKAECVHSKDPTGDTSFMVAVCMFAVLSLLCVVGTVTGKVVDERNRKYEEKEIPLKETGKSEGHTNVGFDDESNKNGSMVLAVPSIAKHSEVALPPVASGDCMLVSVSATGSGDGTTKPNGEASTMTNGTAPETDQCRNVPAEKKSDGLCTRLIRTFSVVKNGTAILNCQQGRGDLGCVHGIRVLSITWVVLGHSFAMFDNPGLGNLTDLPRAMTLWTMAPVVSGTLSVDTFFTLSGILTTYVFLRRAEHCGGVGYTDMVHYYIHRFWRLTPLYMVTIVFWTCITPYLAIGPFDTRGPDIENCRTYWWHNLLYITNIADVDTMCLGWGWYLSNDMQFYVIAPVALLPWAFGKRMLGMVMCFLLLLVHVISVGVINFQENTMLFIRNTDVYMRKVYFPPWCRVGPFAIGLVLGYILFATRGKVTMSKLSVFLGWLFATAVGLTVVYVLYDNSKDMYPDLTGTWSNAEASAYEALSRPAWACAVCWVVFACCTGYGGFVNTLLSWGAWMPLSRLTYGCYLLHLIVLSVFFWNMTDTFYFSSISVTELFLAVTVISYMAAFVFALLVESPTLGVEKVVLGGGSTRGAKKAR